jgi:ElaB/YqjD/DUF883 family membrane-anchored ribosome-binding protein
MTIRLAAAIAVGLAVAACADDDGPAENLGEQIDDAMNETRDRLEDVADEAQEAADEAREAAEEIGDALRDE